MSIYSASEFTALVSLLFGDLVCRAGKNRLKLESSTGSSLAAVQHYQNRALDEKGFIHLLFLPLKQFRPLGLLESGALVHNLASRLP